MMAPNPSLAQTQSYGLRSLWLGLRARLRELYAVLRPCRFSLFVIASGGAFLLLTPQGSEVAVRLPEEPFWWRGVLFHLCVFIWAFESWYSARVLLRILFSEDRSANLNGEMLSGWQQQCVDQVPRYLAVFASVLRCIALYHAPTTSQLLPEIPTEV